MALVDQLLGAAAQSRSKRYLFQHPLSAYSVAVAVAEDDDWVIGAGDVGEQTVKKEERGEEEKGQDAAKEVPAVTEQHYCHHHHLPPHQHQHQHPLHSHQH